MIGISQKVENKRGTAARISIKQSVQQSYHVGSVSGFGKREELYEMYANAAKNNKPNHVCVWTLPHTVATDVDRR